MKKYIITTILALCSLLNMQAQKEQEVSSELKKVVVFPFEAQLFKQAEVTLPGNTVLLKFTKLSPYIEEKSIRVSGDKSLTILNVSSQQDFLSEKEMNEKVKAIKNKINVFKDKQEDFKVQIKVLEDKDAYLEANKTMSQQSAASPAKYQEMSIYFTNLMKEDQLQLLKYNRQVNAYADSIQTYNTQINQLNLNQKEPSGIITVLVSSKESYATKIDLSYIVGRASWIPSYDIRFEGLTKPLTLNYKANVTQQSGYDWNDIKLSLSTAETQKSADIPLLHPLYLGYVYTEQPTQANNSAGINNGEISGVVKDEKGEVVIGAVVKVKGTSIGGITDYNGQYTLKNIPQESNTLEFSYLGMETKDVNIYGNITNVVLKDLSKELNEVVVTGYGPVAERRDIVASVSASSGKELVDLEESTGDGYQKKEKIPDGYQTNVTATRKPTTSTFEVDETQTVKSENKTSQIPFKQAEVPCIFEYKAIPKLSEKVYLMARIPSWVDFGLQTADANLYFENAFIGQTQINTNSLNDTLSVSFGPDQGISIKREKIKDYTENVSFGSKQQQTLSWRIVIKNNKNEDVKVDVYDQVPLTKQDDSSIKALELSGGELKETTGEVHWPVSLAAGASKELILTVQVKYPKGKRIILK